ncbi:exodeoxyribonuclease III [Candidatus Endolissoclinum faulkneri L2]|uniref:Exodeoxyribonuclease III n=1 Tax=Candidatus Endolissoclinum faulkneri L2 TaxID=1193729 RepID=K7ZD97_9PROT|nr:exodeoxyribonuclease III [Candidatus Endolissoclinum faulkneri]AFX99331.1 exodeoxyribonuclease III [Candidatus Endolissoclinum faulkneri L2]
MKFATWNVNSIRARISNVLSWLKTANPDVVMLQEIKVLDEYFPRLKIQELGYQCAVHGQKGYNGVAILSNRGFDNVLSCLPGGEEEDARYLEATIDGIRVANIYMPNGNPVNSKKYVYKLNWMKRLKARAEELLIEEMPVILGGDYNVIPTDDDVYDHDALQGNALIKPEIRAAFREILWLGYTNAFRAKDHTKHKYSYWDYSGGAWQNDHGFLIDHLLLSPQAADRLEDAGIDITPRGQKKASDHTPVWCTLADLADH